MIDTYLDDPKACLQNFAEYGWDEESDELAEAYVEKYAEEMKLHYEGQDELWNSLAWGATEEVREDLTNDRWESAVAVNIVTKATLFWRYGDEDETFLQEENREMITDPNNTALIHNHWNNTPASQADFDSALWLGVRYLIVVTPSGKQYLYERKVDKMEFLDEIFNREHVALPSPVEDAESRIGFALQSLMEIGNPAERVMEQGEGQVVIDTRDGTLITLTPLEGVRLEVSQTLAEHLWEKHVNDWEKWAYESYGYVPQEGSVEYLGMKLDLTQKCETFSQNETSRQRDAAYKLRDEMLKQGGGMQSEIMFFHAAQTVNHFMSLNEYIGNVIIANISAGRGPLDPSITITVTRDLNDIGMGLIDHNDPILATLVENEGRLPSPYYDSPEDMGAPTARFVDAAIDWDIHMVWREQGEVERLIKDLEIKEIDLRLITAQFDQEETARNLALGESVAAIDWAANAVRDIPNFAKEEHRRAIGIAMMFQAHGYSEDDFNTYYSVMMASVKEQTGQEIYTLPTVEEVLGQDN